MKVELRAVKIQHKLSEETMCFSASLWVDGFRVADVGNRGCGGPDEVFIVDRPKYAALEAYVKALPPVPPGDEEWAKDLGPLPMDMDLYVAELLTAWEQKDQMKKTCRKHVMFKVKGDKPDTWRTIKLLPGDRYSAKYRDHLKKKYGDQLDRIANEEVASGV